MRSTRAARVGPRLPEGPSSASRPSAARRAEQSEYALGRLLAFKEFPSSGGVARSAGVVPLSFNLVLKERTKALRKAGLLHDGTTPPCGHPSKGGESMTEY